MVATYTETRAAPPAASDLERIAITADADPSLLGELQGWQLGQVPTIGELAAQTIYSGALDPAIPVPIFLAPFPCRVTFAAIMVYNGLQNASDTDYWTFILRRMRAATAATIVFMDTKVTNGYALAQRTEYSFEHRIWSTTNSLLEKGDAIDMIFTKTGTPTALTNCIFTVRYEPV